MEKESKSVSEKRGGWKKRLLIAVAILLAIILIVAGTGIAVIYHYLGLVNIESPADSVSNGGLQSIIDEVDSDIVSGVSDATSSELEEIENDFKENQEREILHSDDVINVLLIGTDGRTPTERGRSDSMMLVSLNKVSKKLYITSIMRDTYVDIPGVALGNRINASYSRGGATLLMETVERNFRISVDKYVSVNFDSFELLVDYFGGIEMTVSDAEAGQITGIEEGGTYLLTGPQALQYARIRHVGQGDFERTERQRRVLNILIEKCKALNIFELTEVLDFVLPNVSTNMSRNEMFEYVLSSPAYMSYEIVNQRVPCDDSWSYKRIRGMSVLGVNFSKNIDFLKSTVYEGIY